MNQPHKKLSLISTIMAMLNVTVHLNI